MDRLGRVAGRAGAVRSALDQSLAQHAVADGSQVEPSIVKPTGSAVVGSIRASRWHLGGRVSQAAHPPARPR